jgi:ABC-type transport system substrate-binding protein
MCSPTAAKKATTPEKRVFDHMVGTGPFKISEYKQDVYAKYVKWDGYWQNGAPYLDVVEFRAIADTTTRIMAFKAGDGQFIEPLQPVERNQLEKDGFPTTEGTMGFISFICMDGNNPKSPFADIRVRQAVEYAIDKEGLYKGLFQNRWPPAYQQALRNDPYFNPDVKPRVYSVAKAKQLLAEAGYPKGFKTTLHSETRGSKEQQEAIRSLLFEAGIDCTMDIADPARFTVMINTGWEGLMMPGFPNPSSTKWLAQRFGSSAYYVNKYAPPGYYEKWATVASQQDQNIRVDQVKNLLQTMVDEVITIPIYETHPQSASNGKLIGLDWCGKKNTNYWNPTGAYLKK